MKKSAIIKFIMFVINSFSAWFDASILGKIGKKFGKSWQKITQKSFFASFLSTSAGKCTYRDSSFLYKWIKSGVELLRKGFLKISGSVSNSSVISGFKWYYGSFFEISIAHYGKFLISAALTAFLLLAVSKRLSAGWAIATALAGIVGILAVLIKPSLSALFSGSIFAKWFEKITALKMPANENTISVSVVSSRVFMVLGVLYAAFCYAIGFLYATLLFAGVICIGAVIYNFKIGVYVALVIFPFAPTMAIVGITLITLLSLGLKAITDKDFKFARTPLDVPILVFMAALLLSTVTSYTLVSSIKIFMVYIVFVAGYFVVTNAIRDFKTLIPVLVLMLVASLGVAAYGIYQHIFGFAEGTTWTDTDMFTDIATRVVSTFENPNVLGEYLLLLIPVGVAMFISSKGAFAKTEHLLITAALGICMIYTYSRGNWIGLIVAIAVFILFYDSRFVWLGIIALFAAPFLLSQTIITRFTSIGDTRDSSTSYRVFIWKGTFNMLKDYWLCGIGLGTDAFNMVYTNYAYDTIVAPHSHNLYLQVITENGILGLVSFLTMMVAYFKTVISEVIKKKRSLYKAIILSLAAGVFGYLVQGLFDNVWYNYRIFYMFFAVLGLTMAAVNALRKENADD